MMRIAESVHPESTTAPLMTFLLSISPPGGPRSYGRLRTYRARLFQRGQRYSFTFLMLSDSVLFTSHNSQIMFFFSWVSHKCEVDKFMTKLSLETTFLRKNEWFLTISFVHRFAFKPHEGTLWLKGFCRPLKLLRWQVLMSVPKWSSLHIWMK